MTEQTNRQAGRQIHRSRRQAGRHTGEYKEHTDRQINMGQKDRTEIGGQRSDLAVLDESEDVFKAVVV